MSQPFGTIRKPVEDRFWSKVDKLDSNSCWLWTGARVQKGYGSFRVSYRRKFVTTHRFSWELHYGPIPDGMHVLHKCDTPQCVRPDHLFLGTNQDNIIDKISKGRQSCGEAIAATKRGELNPASKLKTIQVVEIRRRYASGGVTYKKLAEEYRVTLQTIGKIVKRVRWRNLQEVKL